METAQPRPQLQRTERYMYLETNIQAKMHELLSGRALAPLETPPEPEPNIFARLGHRIVSAIN